MIADLRTRCIEVGLRAAYGDYSTDMVDWNRITDVYDAMAPLIRADATCVRCGRELEVDDPIAQYAARAERDRIVREESEFITRTYPEGFMSKNPKVLLKWIGASEIVERIRRGGR